MITPEELAAMKERLKEASHYLVDFRADMERLIADVERLTERIWVLEQRERIRTNDFPPAAWDEGMR